MRRPPRRAAPAVVSLALALAATTACGDGNGEDDAATDTQSAEGSSSDDGGPPRPSFAEPASGRLALMGTRTEDISLQVLGIEPGVTELFIDEVPLGPLSDGSLVGHLDTSALRLFVRGSLVSASHRMVMRTANVSGTAESDLVIVDIVADATLTPVAPLDDAPALTGRHLVPSGHGQSSVLLVLDEDDVVRVVPLGDAGWDAAGARTLSTPGLPAPAERRTPAISALRRDRSEDDPGRLRVAWRVGEPGTRIDVIDAAWDEVEPTLEPTSSLTVEDALAGRPAEWAELRRPWLVGDRLLATMLAPADVEAPHPGDRALVQARVVGDAEILETPQRVTVGADLVDLDGLGPAIDRIAAELGRPAPFTLRVDQREPRVLDLDLERGVLQTRPTVVPGPSIPALDTELPWVTITGAFGSRTVASLHATEEGSFVVAFLDDLGGTVEVAAVAPERLPSLAEVTGPIAPGSIDGLSVFLVPFGDASPVHAVYAVGDLPTAVPLPDLHCDEVALATSGGDDSLALACARAGELRLGSLGTVSSEEG